MSLNIGHTKYVDNVMISMYLFPIAIKLKDYQ
jgi:hypothetical protein